MLAGDNSFHPTKYVEIPTKNNDQSCHVCLFRISAFPTKNNDQSCHVCLFRISALSVNMLVPRYVFSYTLELARYLVYYTYSNKPCDKVLPSCIDCPFYTDIALKVSFEMLGTRQRKPDWLLNPKTA